MRSARLSLPVMLALAGVACGAGGGHAGAGGPLDACTLISTSRAGAILGTHLTSKHIGPRPTRAAEGSECLYSSGRVGGGFMLIAARPGFDDAKVEAQSQMDTARREQPPPGIPGIHVHSASGPGEAAWLGTSSVSTQLHVLDHGVSLVIGINRTDSPAVRASARRLAQAALEHLKQ